MAKTTHPNVSDAQERDTANMKVLVLGLCRTGTMCEFNPHWSRQF